MSAVPAEPAAAEELAEREGPASSRWAAVYRETAHLLDPLTRLFPAYISYPDADLPDWPWLILDTPEGQLAWPISPEDLGLFRHVPVIEGIERDGISKEAKYDRLRTLCSKLPKMTYAHPVYGQP